MSARFSNKPVEPALTPEQLEKDAQKFVDANFQINDVWNIKAAMKRAYIAGHHRQEQREETRVHRLKEALKIISLPRRR